MSCPRWHDNNKTIVYRVCSPNPGLETDTRIFLLISGAPATEFMIPRNVKIDINVPSWKQISESIDAIITPQDLYRIPPATPVELRGNELHRVTMYEGEKPSVRYFMRVYLFPEGHSQREMYRNEFFDWQTHPLSQPSEITKILGNVNEFLDKAFAHLNRQGVDVSDYEMTHLCYRVATDEEFLTKMEELSRIGTLISSVLAEGRPYLVYKLDNPIIYQEYSVSLIALPYPKSNNTYPTALQHVAFLMNEDISTLLNKYPEIEFDILELNRVSHPEIKLRFDDLVVKFHNVSLEVLAEERR